MDDVSVYTRTKVFGFVKVSLFFKYTDPWGVYTTQPDTAIVNIKYNFNPLIYISDIMRCFDPVWQLKLINSGFSFRVLKIPDFSIRSFADPGFSHSGFYRFRLFSFPIRCFTDSQKKTYTGTNWFGFFAESIYTRVFSGFIFFRIFGSPRTFPDLKDPDLDSICDHFVLD